MDANTITPIATLITMIAGFIAIIRFLFSLKNEITNLRVELSDRISKIESKLDITADRQIAANQRVDKLENQINNEIKEQRAESNNLINKAFDVITKDIPKQAAL